MTFLDIHSHILPAIDDGAKDMETALALLEMLKSQGVTDVIATPHFYPDEDNAEDYFNLDTGELMLGDIVISADKVISQAEEYGHTVMREYCFLIVHSMLHLFGYDHMEENERLEMERHQDCILNAIEIRRDKE